jgi:hypothetical protein
MLLLSLLLACGAPSAPVTCAPVAELCDGADNDCDGTVDEGFDLDGDGAYRDDTGCRTLQLPIDCDDEDASVHPGADEICFNGVDDDCSGAEDDGVDADGDSFPACLDCDDADAFVFPGAAETCDGLDNDCSGAADEAWDLDGDGSAGCAGDCDDADPTRAPGIPEQCNGWDDDCDGETDEGFDADADGWRTCRGDCDDADPLVNPAQPEVCDGAGADNDCDPSTLDAEDPDADGYTLCDGDCAPTQGGAYPGGVETCDGLDNDCDGAADELPGCYGCVQPDPTGAPDTWVCGSYVTWERASAACASFGLRLPVVTDAARNAYFRDLGYWYLGAASWIGARDAAVEGEWTWEDGTPATFTQWHGGQPDDYAGEDCAGINFGDWGYWNDYPCTYNLPFMCEAAP